jgi:hypothetical protein
VLKFLSINNNVTAAVNTGNDNNNNHAVKNTAQTNNGISIIYIPIVLIFNVVTIKLIAPNKLLIVVKCKANIAKSTDADE